MKPSRLRVFIESLQYTELCLERRVCRSGDDRHHWQWALESRAALQKWMPGGRCRDVLKSPPCAWCGKVRPYKKGTICCSPECARKLITSQLIKKCQWCGESFKPQRDTVRFCSLMCACQWKSSRPGNTCKFCKKPIFGLGKHTLHFCKRVECIKQRREASRIQNRIADNIRTRVLRVVTRGWKSAHTLQLVGCSAKSLRLHLQNRFMRGMNWNNYGSYWHIDHIMPCASFDLTNPAEQRACFHYSNLRPLYKKKNRAKSDKIEPHQLEFLITLP